MADANHGGARRLWEIINILRRHNLLSGLTPDKFRAVVEDLGPTFVKLGQMLSMRPDVLPIAYCDALQRLRSEVTPMPLEAVYRVVEHALGKPVASVFPTFDPQPLGSASIAQVHRATLADGSRVVVKVQREGVHEKMASDIQLLRKASRLLRLTPTGETVDFRMVLDELWAVSQQEMNFINEADNVETFLRFNAGIRYIGFPRVYREVSAREVLVMEAIEGSAIDDLPALRAAGYDPSEISRKLCLNYMKQILDDGFFHADPHPGNLRVQDGRIVWLDMGMVGKLTPKDRASFQKAVSAAATHDVGAMTDAVLAISRHSAPVRREALYADVDGMLSQYLQADIGSLNLSDMIRQVLDLAHRHGLSLPAGVTMLGRGVSTLEGLIAAISPDVNLMELVSQRFVKHAFEDLDWKQLVRNNAQAVYESAQKSLSTPSLLNDVLRAALKGELKVRIDSVVDREAAAADAKRNIRFRHTLLGSACLIGASITAFAPVEPRWLGLPWISLAGYAVAFAVLAFDALRYRKQ